MSSKNYKSSDLQCLITGVYRSGTEFFSKALNLSDEISSSNYKVNILRFHFNQILNSNYKKSLEDIVESLEKRIFTRYKIYINSNFLKENIFSERIINIGQLYDAVMQSIYFKESDKCRKWAEKNQLLWREIPLFVGMMPNPKSIIIVRDPRAVLASFLKYTRYAYPAALGAPFNWYDCCQSIKNYSQLVKDKLLVIKYENLINNSDSEWDKVRKHLQINLPSFDEINNQLNSIKYQANSSFQDGTFHKEFNNKISINKWEEFLNIDQIKFVEAICSDFMEDYDYKLKYNISDKHNFLNKFSKEIPDNLQINNAIYNFQKYSLGIESFPADPTDPKTWEK